MTGSGGTIKLDSAAAAFNVGDVVIRGSGEIRLDLGNASSVGSINTTGHVATATIDLSGVNSGVTVLLGASANKVVLSSASDSVSFRSNTGIDKVYFASTGVADQFGRYFQFGTSQDSISFGTAAFSLGLGSAEANNQSSALNILVASAASNGLVFNSAGATDQATDLVIFADSAFASFADMASSLRGLSAVGTDTSYTAANGVLVLWYDSTNGRTELSLVAASANAGTLASAIPAAGTALAYFDTNIVTVSADTFGQFFTYAEKDITGL